MRQSLSKTHLISFSIFFHFSLILLVSQTSQTAPVENWRRVLESPYGRSEHQIVYDSQRDKMLVFGGLDILNLHILGMNDLWEYDPATNHWTQLNKHNDASWPGRPAPRMSHAMIYDSLRGKVILCGGVGLMIGDTVDLHEYNPQLNEWTNITPIHGPSYRGGHDMVYDSIRDKYVLFGGNEANISDTWEYDPDDGVWTELHPPNAPSPRNNHTMAFDSISSKIFLFGGQQINTNTLYNDLWEYDPNQNDWRLLTYQQGPSARHYHSMVCDTSRNVLIIYGGSSINNTMGDLWEYRLDRGEWQEKTPLFTPPARFSHDMIFRKPTNTIIMFGGLEDNAPPLQSGSSVWEYTPVENEWQATLTCPHARESHTMAYDDLHQRVYLFGGATLTARLDDFWVLDLEQSCWHPLNATNGPSARKNHAMAFDFDRGHLYIFGGTDIWDRLNDIWRYDPGTNIWNELYPRAVPEPRNRHTLVYNHSKRTLLLFGGKPDTGPRFNDLWEFNPDSYAWQRLRPNNPPSGRSSHAATFDWINGKMYVFGGQDAAYRDDLWEYDVFTESWRIIQTTLRPPARIEHILEYDGVQQRLLMFGGKGEYDVRLNDIWAFDIQSEEWQELKPQDRPEPRTLHAGAYCTNEKKLIIFGGEDGLKMNDTWEFGAVPANPRIMMAGYLDSEISSSNGGSLDIIAITSDVESLELSYQGVPTGLTIPAYGDTNDGAFWLQDMVIPPVSSGEYLYTLQGTSGMTVIAEWPHFEVK